MLKIGDIVKLNSGGPLMTIYELDKNLSYVKGYRCEWFDVNDLHHQGYFIPATLMHVNKIIKQETV